MNESLIEQISEIRALQVVNTFMLQTLLESVGCDAEAMIDAVDKMNTNLANRFEDQMRKACGMEPRPKPRTPVLPKLEEFDLMRNAPWHKMNPQ